jgi:aerobic carbon-monoxide dehydrogenase small subunit
VSDELPITLNVNGEERRFLASPGRTLLDVLREVLGLTGAKRACDQGICGACTVLIDGRAARSCLCLAISCSDRQIVTVEGLAEAGSPSPVQQAFVDAGAVQCGYCMPGMVVTATALLREDPAATLQSIREALAGNLCRCSGYVKVIDAVLLAASRLADQSSCGTRR